MSLKKYSVPFGRLRIADRFTISLTALSIVGDSFASSDRYFLSIFSFLADKPTVIPSAYCFYFDRSQRLTASLTFSIKEGDTDSSSIPMRRKLSVRPVSAASSPQIPIHAP